jgi:hypothetical protein
MYSNSCLLPARYSKGRLDTGRRAQLYDWRHRYRICKPIMTKANPYTYAESLPILFDDEVATASGFEDIVAYLRNHPTVTNDLDVDLSSRQRTDRTA